MPTMADSVQYAISPLTVSAKIQQLDISTPDYRIASTRTCTFWWSPASNGSYLRIRGLVVWSIGRVQRMMLLLSPRMPPEPLRPEKRSLSLVGHLEPPAILERSGIGDPEILKGAGVPVVAEVPGVGRNYQDHYTMMYSYKSSLAPDETLDGILNGNFNIGELISKNGKILGWNAIDATCKLRPSDADIAALGPKFQGVWDKEYQNNLNKPLAMMSLVDR